MSIKFTFSFLLSFHCFFCFASTDTLFSGHSKHYTDADGLPQNSIKAIAKDKYGFLWMTTEDGLVRFDGNHFQNFSRGTAGLSSGRFWHIIPDWEKDIFFASNDKGELVSIANGTAVPDTASGDKLRRSLSFIPGLPDFQRFGAVGLPERINGIMGLDEKSVIQYDFNTVFIYANNYVTLFKEKKQVYRIRFEAARVSHFFLIKQDLYYFNDDATITAIGPSGINTIYLGGDIISNRVKDDGKKDGIIYWNINNPDNIVFYRNRCFYVIKKEDRHFQSTLIVSGFPGPGEVASVYYDEKEQNLFVGSFVNGLYVFSHSQFLTLHQNNSTGDNVYYAQALFKEKKVLTGQGNLFEAGNQPVLNVFGNYPAVSDKYSIAVDEAGFVWTKTNNNLFRISPENFKITNSWKLREPISVLYIGKKRTLWIGQKKGGLEKMDLSGTPEAPQLIEKLPAEITYLKQQDDSILWIGSTEGLFRYNMSTKHYNPVAWLPNKYIRSLYSTGPEETWITTYEDGFYLLKNGKLTQFPVDKDHYLLTAHCIVEDRGGFFWITTNKGLFRASKNDLLSYATRGINDIYYQYFSKNEGLATNEFNGGCEPCGLELPDGRLSFPSISGLLWFNPDSVKMALPAQALFVDKILLDNKPLPISSRLELPGDMKQLKIFTSTPYWGNPGNVVIQYALVKSDEPPIWLPVDNENAISLSTLPSGNFVLLIRKKNGFDNDRFMQKVILLSVPAPWTHHPLVLAGAAIMLAILIILFIRLRTNYIAQKNRDLEKRISENTKELQSTLNELESFQDELVRQTEMQKKLIASFTHDIKAPMQYLMLTADKIYQGLQRENSSAFVQPAKIVNDHIRRLYYLMDNILHYIKTQITETHVNHDIFNLEELVFEKISIYKDIADQSGTSLENDIDKNFIARTNKALLAVILHNLLDNAVKVTENGLVRVSATNENGKISIMIADNGIGIKDELLNWINEPDTGFPKKQTVADKQSGIGLFIVKDLAALLKIQLHASSRYKQTVITLVLPVLENNMAPVN